MCPLSNRYRPERTTFSTLLVISIQGYSNTAYLHIQYSLTAILCISVVAPSDSIGTAIAVNGHVTQSQDIRSFIIYG